LYYNALFEQGLHSAEKALDYSQRTKETNFIGSAENVVGLQLMNLNRLEVAAIFLRRAVNHLQAHHPFDELAFQYHAYTNLGECYVYLQQPDSAIKLSQMALPEAQQRGRKRGEANAYWNIAQAYILKK
jgi:tetratricopeptide (TPR) repeat protein